MQYSRRTLIIVGLLGSVVTISCGQSQHDAAAVSATEDQNTNGAVDHPKTVVDPKGIESYWTKEKMEKAKPMPTPTVIIDPNAPETSRPDVQPDGQGTPGGKSGSQ